MGGLRGYKVGLAASMFDILNEVDGTRTGEMAVGRLEERRVCCDHGGGGWSCHRVDKSFQAVIVDEGGERHWPAGFLPGRTPLVLVCRDITSAVAPTSPCDGKS